MAINYRHWSVFFGGLAGSLCKAALTSVLWALVVLGSFSFLLAAEFVGRHLSLALSY
jgi:hypothetical protein